jgi:hypothetical protein
MNVVIISILNVESKILSHKYYTRISLSLPLTLIHNISIVIETRLHNMKFYIIHTKTSQFKLRIVVFFCFIPLFRSLLSTIQLTQLTLVDSVDSEKFYIISIQIHHTWCRFEWKLKMMIMMKTWWFWDFQAYLRDD